MKSFAIYLTHLTIWINDYPQVFGSANSICSLISVCWLVGRSDRHNFQKKGRAKLSLLYFCHLFCRSAFTTPFLVLMKLVESSSVTCPLCLRRAQPTPGMLKVNEVETLSFMIIGRYLLSRDKGFEQSLHQLFYIISTMAIWNWLTFEMGIREVIKE